VSLEIKLQGFTYKLLWWNLFGRTNFWHWNVSQADIYSDRFWCRPSCISTTCRYDPRQRRYVLL